MPHTWQRPSLLALIWLAALLLLAAAGAGIYLNARNGVPQRSDFTLLYASVKSTQQFGTAYHPFFYHPFFMQTPFLPKEAPKDEEIHPTTANLNAPVTLLLVTPFAALPFRTAYYVWCGVQMLLALGVWLWLLRRLFPDRPEALPLGLLALTVYFPVFANLLIGEMGLFLFVALALAWRALEARQEVWAGIFLGLALVLKPFVGLAFVWLLLSRRFRILGAGAATWLALMLLGLGFYGWSDHLQYFNNLHHMEWKAMTWNGALEGLLARSFGGTPTPSLLDWPGLRWTLRALAWGGTLLALLGLAHHRPSSEVFRLGLTATLPLMLLLSPLGWIYYFPILLLAALPLLTGPYRRFTLLALMLSGLPQFLSMRDNYRPALWYPHQGGLLGSMPGDLPAASPVYYWLLFPEAYTLALIVLALLALRTAYRARSTHTGT